MKARAPFSIWLSYALIVAALALPALLNDHINGDIYWQRWLGERILSTHAIPRQLGSETLTAAGAPWVAQEWALSIALAVADRIHAFLVLALLAILAVVATLLLAGLRMSRRKARGPLLFALCTILIGLSVRGTFGVRAQTFAWPLFAVLLLLLDEGGPMAWWTVPLTVVWSNVHASVMLAPVMSVLYAVGTFADARAWTPRATRYAILAPVLLAAACLNPLGWRIPLYALSLQGSPIHSYISEWQPLRATDYGLWLLVAPVCFGIALAAWRGVRPTVVDMLVTLACGYLAVTALRNLPIFAIAAAPIACANLSRAFPQAQPRIEGSVERALQIAAAAVALPMVALLTFLHSDYARAEAVLPVRAIDRLARVPGAKRVFCFDFGSCSVALDDGMRTFMDGRCDPFPLPVWDQYRTVFEARPGWEGILEKYDVTFVLAPGASAFGRAMQQSGRWKSVYSDGVNLVFERQPMQKSSPRYVRT